MKFLLVTSAKDGMQMLISVSEIRMVEALKGGGTFLVVESLNKKKYGGYSVLESVFDIRDQLADISGREGF